MSSEFVFCSVWCTSLGWVVAEFVLWRGMLSLERPADLSVGLTTPPIFLYTLRQASLRMVLSTILDFCFDLA